MKRAVESDDDDFLFEDYFKLFVDGTFYFFSEVKDFFAGCSAMVHYHKGLPAVCTSIPFS